MHLHTAPKWWRVLVMCQQQCQSCNALGLCHRHAVMLAGLCLWLVATCNFLCLMALVRLKLAMRTRVPGAPFPHGGRELMLASDFSVWPCSCVWFGQHCWQFIRFCQLLSLGESSSNSVWQGAPWRRGQLWSTTKRVKPSGQFSTRFWK